MKWILPSSILRVIPDNFFDAILVVHVIEHLYNGDEVLKGLLSEIKVMEDPFMLSIRV